MFDENPLAEFVELPDDGRAQDELWFSNILCGVLRGALEMVIFSNPAKNTRTQATDSVNRYKCRSRRIL